MADKCNPKYKNLNQIHSFSEQSYVTVQLMQQACMNDEFLKQYCDKLDYLSPPHVRKRFNPVNIDESKSYGYQVNHGDDKTNGRVGESTVSFSSRRSDEIYIDFSNETLKYVNLDINDVDIISDYSDDEVNNYVVLPQKTRVTPDYDTKNFEKGEIINAYWYVGQNKEKSYQVRPDWLKDWKDDEIPSIVRAQSFKAESSGLLEAITLAIGQTEGASSSNWGSPLYVQIWPTKRVTCNKMKWDKKTKQAVKDNGTETVWEPVTLDSEGNSTIYNPLAEGSLWPENTSPGFFSVVFDNPCKVVEGEHYAVVMFSPLSNGSSSCPRIGGWGLNCSTHKYGEGDAFLSENNGRTFMRYGRSDLGLKTYKQGKYTPRDFAFQCNITDYDDVYDDSEENYLYLKPILANPISQIKISGTGDGIRDSEQTHVDFQISTNGGEWHSLTPGLWESLPDNPIMVCVRVKMWQTSNDNKVTPTLTSLSVDLKYNLPTKMYVRTHYFRPKIGAMLGANIWGKINAPFICDNNVKCNVDVIHDKINREHFTIITAAELDDYVYIKGIDGNRILNKSLEERYNYLVSNPQVIERLKEHGVYVKPAMYKDNRYEFSFEEGLKLSNSPSYPILSCMTQPKYEGIVNNYAEFVDFEVDYETDIVNFYNSDTIDKLPVGALSFEYNPLFIKNISAEEMPLVLDYFEEEFIVSEDILKSRGISLRCDTVDPLRHVIRNPDSDFEEELLEDLDFIVNYAEKTINFPIIDFENNLSVLELGDVIKVIYTPNLEDTGIALGYYATRDKINKDCKIQPNYFEYKV